MEPTWHLYQDHSRLIPVRDRPLGQLAPVTLIKATAVTLASLVGQQYIQLNVFWVALTTVLIAAGDQDSLEPKFSPRGGTVLGACAGYGLVWFKSTNEFALQAVEVLTASC